jgi:polyribonucleotide nucleotidyltransferase
MEATSRLVTNQINIPLGNKNLIISTGPFAGLANQSLLCRYGDTEVLVAVTMSRDVKEGIDFFPLTVNYEEKMYAAGKIPGGYIKKEGRPSDSSILTGRAIDRPIRPLFPEGLRNEIQCVIFTLSADQEDPPDIPGIIGTATALYLSDIPFDKPMAAVRVGLNDGEFVVNPTYQELDKSPLDIIIATTRDRVLMIEAGGNEIAEQIVMDAIEFGHEQCRKIIDAIEGLRGRIGKTKTVVEPIEVPSEELAKFVDTYIQKNWSRIQDVKEKKIREAEIESFKKELAVQKFGEEKKEWTPEELAEQKQILELVEKSLKKRMRKQILEKKKRIDGRRPDEIRDIWCDVGTIPRAHGSAIFTRGETQAMTIATLGAIGDKQKLDDIGIEESKRYMHHYYAAPFCYGETGAMRGPGRREIGHGALAEKALASMIPLEAEFPYTIRLVTEILSSNGSTSMASVCGSTLSLMDAGVPIHEPVAGIAMGLVTSDKDDEFVVLTDLMGMEDFYGDMDFKVAGTKNGVTAIQLDTKVIGLTHEMIREIFEKARIGRMYILDRILETISKPRAELSPYAPRIITLNINPEKIGDLIGPGGKVVRGIIEETGVEIDIEDDGRVYITSINAAASQKAVELVNAIVHEPQVGEQYDGRVVKIATFGAFIRLTPSTDGLLHVSQICERRIENVDSVLRVGDIIRVKVMDIDTENGKISLTRRGLEFPDGDPILDRIGNIVLNQQEDRSGRPRSREQDGNRDRRPGGDRGSGDRRSDRGGGRDRRPGDRDRRDRH